MREQLPKALLFVLVQVKQPVLLRVLMAQTSTGGTAVFVNGSNQLGTTTSSRRFKHDINSMADDSASIYQLNPVTFAYNSDETDTKQYGLIAEEVDEVFPDIVVKDEDGQPYTVQYHVFRYYC